MSLVPAKITHQQHETILTLEKEISLLEEELQDIEQVLNEFESKIRLSLQQQILRLRELNSLYKAQKAAKKARRLAQKKKGKNYKEPKGVIRTPQPSATGPALTKPDQQELKRLYKEAIVLVHPDKFVLEDDSINARATDLTTQLNALYKSGKLEELSDFHEHIISGNAMSHINNQPASIADPAALLIHLKKKKAQLNMLMAEYKQSQTYTILYTYEDPYSFISELRLQFEERILVMEKRTRKV